LHFTVETASLKKTGKQIIPITIAQVSHLCGNTIELNNNKGDSILVMSQQAYDNFSEHQLKKITQFSKILPVDLKTIETIGGGSARCMIAEIFVPTQNTTHTPRARSPKSSN
jgi:hypothetical protein